MTDEQQQKSDVPSFGTILEIGAVHAVGASIIRWFFRSQGHDGNFWEAGDESIMANGLNGLFDIFYWLVKPRLMRWRKG